MKKLLIKILFYFQIKAIFEKYKGKISPNYLLKKEKNYLEVKGGSTYF